jgi:hypothetical protein
MINIDQYIITGIDYVHKNPLFFGALLGLLKLIALRTPSVTDDKILTWIGQKIGIRF